MISALFAFRRRVIFFESVSSGWWKSVGRKPLRVNGPQHPRPASSHRQRLVLISQGFISVSPGSPCRWKAIPYARRSQEKTAAVPACLDQIIAKASLSQVVFILPRYFPRGRSHTVQPSRRLGSEVDIWSQPGTPAAWLRIRNTKTFVPGHR